MKKSILAVLAIGLVLSFGTVAMAGTAPGSGIQNTYHDLSNTGAGIAYGEAADQTNATGVNNRICIYCHAPHNTLLADTGDNTYRPLWNHEASTITSYTMYSNGSDNDTLNITHKSYAADILQTALMPGSVSLLCLSCHDGTTGTNAYGMNAAAGTPSNGTGNLKIGAVAGGRALIGGNGDLSNHHPIGFNYDEAVAYGPDPELFDSSTPITLKNGAATIADLLWKGNVECSSCHDVHNTGNLGDKFTWIQDTGSALCLTCHKKNGP